MCEIQPSYYDLPTQDAEYKPLAERNETPMPVVFCVGSCQSSPRDAWHLVPCAAMKVVCLCRKRIHNLQLGEQSTRGQAALVLATELATAV
jgi:hypothetical protein